MSLTLFLMTLLTATMIFAQAPQEPGGRRITFNGRNLTDREMAVLTLLELRLNSRLPDGNFWYDSRSGAAGIWGGPALALLPAGLTLGGPMPANCSRGGTHVFVNGRELHPLDVARLSQLGPVRRGRYWLDSQMNWGYEGGPMVGNLYAAMRQRNPGRREPIWSGSELMGGASNSAGACTAAGNCAYPNN